MQMRNHFRFERWHDREENKPLKICQTSRNSRVVPLRTCENVYFSLSCHRPIAPL